MVRERHQGAVRLWLVTITVDVWGPYMAEGAAGGVWGRVRVKASANFNTSVTTRGGGWSKWVQRFKN